MRIIFTVIYNITLIFIISYVVLIAFVVLGVFEHTVNAKSIRTEKYSFGK